MNTPTDLSTYGLEKLVEAHNSVGFDRQNDHECESRMAAIRRARDGGGTVGVRPLMLARLRLVPTDPS